MPSWEILWPGSLLGTFGLGWYLANRRRNDFHDRFLATFGSMVEPGRKPVVQFLTHPDGRKLYLGRRQPVIVRPHLKFRNYLRRGLADPPATLDESGPAMPSLTRMMRNDVHGCCVISWCFGHQRGVWTANANSLEITSDEWIDKLYEVIGGWNPNDPSTDNGCEVQDAIHYMAMTGTSPGAVAVNAADETELRLAIQLLGGVTFGMGLPDAWTSDNLNWDVAGPTNPKRGHCFGCPAKYDENIGTSTWGMIGGLTPRAAAKYAVPDAGGECWGILSTKWFNRVTKLAPSGFDIDQLLGHLNAFAA